MSHLLSPLTLGTAQLGQGYGVANKSGPPSHAEVCRMLECAAEQGVNAIDTAAAYGESEAVLGRALRDTGLHGHFTVVTKVHPLAPGLETAAVRQQIRDSLDNSRRRLGIEVLPCVLFHREQNLEYADALLAARNAGICECIGVSIGSPQGLRDALAIEGIVAVQIPTNAVDHRFTETGLLDACVEKSIQVFVRSAFLQGLLLMSDADTPEHLLPIAPARTLLRARAQAQRLPLSEYLLRVLMDHPCMDSIVFGAETVEQLKANTRVLHRAPLPGSSIANDPLPRVPDWILDPPSWNQHRLEVNPAKL